MARRQAKRRSEGQIGAAAGRNRAAGPDRRIAGRLRAALNHGVTVRRGQRYTLRVKAISTPVGP
ncbi:hypothetical protein GZL_02210 [Streptomyces sp. 769]|nr:hypothetical protein GZL_02210 [Streptomyces sp. 769]